MELEQQPVGELAGDVVNNGDPVGTPSATDDSQMTKRLPFSCGGHRSLAKWNIRKIAAIPCAFSQATTNISDMKNSR